MAMLERKNQRTVVHIKDAAAIAATTNLTSMDIKGFHAASFIVNFGAWTDGTYDITLEDSSDNSTFTANSTDVIGSIPSVSSGSTDQTSAEIAYIGTKRYIRLVVTESSAGTTGVVMSVVGLKECPKDLNAL